ncbi:MAG: flagellar biosynthesis anti-sigma factor FlgM [Deltaproteobacteria bacterium]|nr:flagellar biosynthesis anti-sigma factor FlgM [Deltaproteobacteria bacterium]
MKVHSPALDAYIRTATVLPVGSAKPPHSVGASSDAAASEAAHVTISAEGREKAAESAGIDEKKVATLKGRIEAGTYSVNPQILAARLLDKLG